MPALLPFRAVYPADSLYIAGEEEPREMKPGVAGEDDPQAALFLYHQRFGNLVREGVLGLLNRAEARVFPHEQTYSERVAACVDSLRTRRADPGSLWHWCDDATQTLAPLLRPSGKPVREVTDRFGVLHQYWRVSEPFRIRQLQDALQGKDLFLADGHHRFAAGWNLATIQIRTPALHTNPAHRLVQDTNQLQMPHLCPVDDLNAFWRNTPPGSARFGVLMHGEPLKGIEISRSPGETKLSALHNRVIVNARAQTIRNPGQAAAGQTVLLVEAVDIDELERNAQEGILLPPKSTDFYPKLAAGVVTTT